MDRMTVTLPNQAPLRFLSWGAELVASHHGGSAVGYSYEFDTEIQWYKAMFPRPFNILGFRWLHNNGRTIGFAIPWWFPVLLSVILGVVPWISWSAQFNLRVLLLALTLLVLILTLVSFSYRAALRQERIYQHSIGEL